MGELRRLGLVKVYDRPRYGVDHRTTICSHSPIVILAGKRFSSGRYGRRSGSGRERSEWAAVCRLIICVRESNASASDAKGELVYLCLSIPTQPATPEATSITGADNGH